MKIRNMLLLGLLAMNQIVVGMNQPIPQQKDESIENFCCDLVIKTAFGRENENPIVAKLNSSCPYAFTLIKMYFLIKMFNQVFPGEFPATLKIFPDSFEKDKKTIFAFCYALNEAREQDTVSAKAMQLELSELLNKIPFSGVQIFSTVCFIATKWLQAMHFTWLDIIEKRKCLSLKKKHLALGCLLETTLSDRLLRSFYEPIFLDMRIIDFLRVDDPALARACVNRALERDKKLEFKLLCLNRYNCYEREGIRATLQAIVGEATMVAVCVLDNQLSKVSQKIGFCRTEWEKIAQSFTESCEELQQKDRLLSNNLFNETDFLDLKFLDHNGCLFDE